MLDPKQRQLELDREADKRAREGVRVYRPSSQQEPFHRSTAAERILRGGKRSGKSVAAAMEFASQVTGTPLVDRDGNPLPFKYEVPTPENPRQYWIIGYDTKHSGTIYRLLFERGMGGTFNIVKDTKTGQWRTWNRNSKNDRARKSQLAEPLIPERMIVPGSWDNENKAGHEWNSVRLKNGAMLFFFPSSARNPKQGEAVSGIWIDEDIQYPGHLKEWQDRLTDHEGWMIWSVWPHRQNDALVGLLDRAADCAADDNPQIASFQLVMTENPFLTDKGKEQALNRMESPEEVERRNRGELLMDTIVMYDYAPAVHSIRKISDTERAYKPTPVMDWLREHYTKNNCFPGEWTRYLSIDPSHTRTAIHSWCVPPADWDNVQFGDLAICEWELIAKKFTAAMIAEQVSHRVSGRRYEAFIMDKMAGRQTHAGRDDNTFDLFAKAFAEKRIVSRSTLSNFIPGISVVATRYAAVRDLLWNQTEMRPKMLFVEEKCIETRKEFSNYTKKTLTTNGEETILDAPRNPTKYDAMASVEYFAAYIVQQFALGTAYVEPSVFKSQGSPAFFAAQALQKKQEQVSGEYVHLGPGRAA